MVRISIEYVGDLQVQSTHGPSQTRLMTDAPIDNQGKGRSFSPTDLAATALGTCMATIMGIAAQKHSLDLTGMKITVDKEMANQPVRRIGRLKVLFEIPGSFSERDKKLLENVALTCPVHQSFHPDVKIEVDFQWGI